MTAKKNGSKTDFIYGVHTVTAVLEHLPHRAKKLFVARKDHDDFLRELCKNSGVAMELVDRGFLERKFLVGSDAQGLVLQCSPFKYADLKEILAKSKTLLVLDSWQDAANLGRAARAALCFGVDALIICQDRSAQINAAAEKAASGALAQVPVVKVINLATTLRQLKDTGFFIYGADERGELPIKECDFASRAALVIGQEGVGLRQLTKQICDVLVSIPMANSKICLNAADTALLFAYEVSFRKLNNLFRSNS